MVVPGVLGARVASAGRAATGNRSRDASQTRSRVRLAAMAVPAGTGGLGGAGGHVRVIHIGAVLFAPPILLAAGGPGGVGGPGGSRGIKGSFSEQDNGKRGTTGAVGPSGPAGQATLSKVTADVYLNEVLGELGPDAAKWASYRLAIGEYHYRQHNPAIASRADLLARAMGEFDAVLRLDPTNDRAVRLQQQILLDQNILGLPNRLDLIPAFDQYIEHFAAFAPLIFGVFNLGINLVITSDDRKVMQTHLELRRQEIEGAIIDTEEDVRTAVSALKDASDEVQDAQARVVQVTSQIQAALEEMNNDSFSFGGVVGIVAEIGGAVLSVAAAVPTGGASLVGLVPSVIALTASVSENAGPLLNALFTTEALDLQSITDAYKRVSRNAEDIFQNVGEDVSVTNFVNFVNLVHRLAAGTTAANSRSVALVQRGAELVHAQLLAQHRKDQANHTVAATAAKLDRARALLVSNQQLSDKLGIDALKFREAGLSAIRSAQLRVDSVLGFAFRAQRSAEIYILKSEGENLSFDTGYVDPDVEEDYAEELMDAVDLIAAYTESWSRLIQPVRMVDDYLAYFSDNNQLDNDSRRFSFKDPGVLQNFRDTHDFEFSIQLGDLPGDHPDAKIQGVFVAFVGAASPSGVISCEVRHGDRYEQQRPDGSVFSQLLQPRTDTQLARTTRLEPANVSFESAPPLTAPQSLAFWGRGVAGLWSVAIPQSEFELDPPDLTGLSEIQVWVGYQFIRLGQKLLQTGTYK